MLWEQIMSGLPSFRGIRIHFLEKVAVQAKTKGLKRESQKSWAWGGMQKNPEDRKFLFLRERG